MPGFDGGMFSLGFGNPVPPSEDPNTTEVQRLVADLEMRILDGLMEQIKEPAGLLSEIDNQVFKGLNDVSQPIVDKLTEVDRKISNDVGAKVEMLSARTTPLNRLAQKVGINLTSEANNIVGVKADAKRQDLVNTVREAFGEVIKPKEENTTSVSGQQSKVTRASPFRAKQTTNKPIVDVPVPGVLIVPPYIYPVLDEHNINPGDVENIHIWPDGAVHVDHTGGVILFDNPGDWPKPPPRPAPGPPPSTPPSDDDEEIPIPGLHDPPTIDIVQELPAGEEIPISPPGSTVPIPQEGDCPDATVRCGDCNCGPCVCPSAPAISTPPTDTGYETPGGPTSTISDTVTPVVNVLNTINLPEEEEEPPKKMYIGYCNKDTGQIVVRELGQPTTGTNLRAVSANENAQAALIQAKAVCRGRPPEPSAVRTQLTAPDLLGLCSDHSYAPGQTSLHILDATLRNSPIGAFLGIGGQTEQDSRAAYITQLMGWNPTSMFFAFVTKGFSRIVSLFDANLGKMLESYFAAGQDFTDSMAARIAIGIAENWISGDFSKFKQPFVYKSDSIVPSLFPSADQATNAYITGVIDKPTWALWVQMNNFCAEPYEKEIEVNRSKFSPLTLLDMKRRDLITPREYETEFRRLGYMGDADSTQFELVNKFIPPIQDLVRFMVRDTFDQDVVDLLRTDEGFTDKWQNEALEWGDWQGIPDDVAKMYWRAHWQIPSTGQLFDIYHRNRVEPNETEGKFTFNKLKSTLQINDNLPSMIPYLEQISEHLPTRVDIRRAYRLGAIDETQVENNYKMRGYSDANAKIMVKYADNDKEQFLMGRREVKLYRDGLISDAEFVQGMQKYDPKPEMFDYIYKITEAERRAPVIKRCLKQLEKQYLERAIDDDELQQRLDELNVPVVTQERFKEELACLKKSEYKELTANQLCTLYSGGQIAGWLFIERLEKLGYERPEAFEIKMLCDWKIDAREAKINEKAMEAAEKERKRLAKEAAKELAKQERAEARTERMREKRKLANDRRQIRILKVINKLAKCNETSVEVAGGLVRAAMTSLGTLYPFTAEERVSIMERTVEKCKPKTAIEFNAQWVRLANEFDRIQGPLGN